MKMRVPIFAAICVAMLAETGVAAEDELPKRAPGGSLEFEPTLMLDDVDEGVAGHTGSAAALSEEAEVHRLLGDLERARARAKRSEKLYRSGVLAKVDAERAALKVVQLERDLQAARVRLAQSELAAHRKRLEAAEISEEQLKKAEAELAEVVASAAAAEAAWQLAQLDAAALDLKRKRQLFSAGLASRAMVKRAEEKLSALQTKAP